MKTPYIYTLRDPRDGRVKYVGMTTNIVARRSSHKWAAGKGESRKRWIRELVLQSMKPEMVIIETCTPENWIDRERHWIAFYRSQGEPLTNLCPGGETKPPTSDEERKWRSELMKGRIVVQETRSRIQQALIGHPVLEETRDKLRDAANKQFADPAAREAARQKTREQFSNPAARQKQRDAQAAQFADPAKRERHRQALLNWYATMTPAKREQVRQANLLKSQKRWARVREAKQ